MCASKSFEVVFAALRSIPSLFFQALYIFGAKRNHALRGKNLRVSRQHSGVKLLSCVNCQCIEKASAFYLRLFGRKALLLLLYVCRSCCGTARGNEKTRKKSHIITPPLLISKVNPILYTIKLGNMLHCQWKEKVTKT